MPCRSRRAHDGHDQGASLLSARTSSSRPDASPARPPAEHPEQAQGLRGHGLHRGGARLTLAVLALRKPRLTQPRSLAGRRPLVRLLLPPHRLLERASTPLSRSALILFKEGEAETAALHAQDCNVGCASLSPPRPLASFGSAADLPRPSPSHARRRLLQFHLDDGAPRVRQGPSRHALEPVRVRQAVRPQLRQHPGASSAPSLCLSQPHELPTDRALSCSGPHRARRRLSTTSATRPSSTRPRTVAPSCSSRAGLTPASPSPSQVRARPSPLSDNSSLRGLWAD